MEWQEDVCATHSEEKAHEHWSLNQKSFHWSKWTNTMPVVDAKRSKKLMKMEQMHGTQQRGKMICYELQF